MCPVPITQAYRNVKMHEATFVHSVYIQYTFVHSLYIFSTLSFTQYIYSVHFRSLSIYCAFSLKGLSRKRIPCLGPFLSLPRHSVTGVSYHGGQHQAWDWREWALLGALNRWGAWSNRPFFMGILCYNMHSFIMKPCNTAMAFVHERHKRASIVFIKYKREHILSCTENKMDDSCCALDWMLCFWFCEQYAEYTSHLVDKTNSSHRQKLKKSTKQMSEAHIYTPLAVNTQCTTLWSFWARECPLCPHNSSAKWLNLMCKWTLVHTFRESTNYRTHLCPWKQRLLERL